VSGVERRPNPFHGLPVNMAHPVVATLKKAIAEKTGTNRELTYASE
jgi:hypothetical protein